MPSFANEVAAECPKIIEPDMMARIAVSVRSGSARHSATDDNSSVLLSGLATCGHADCNAGM